MTTRRLLLVDDDQAFTQVLSTALRKRDFEVCVASELDSLPRILGENSFHYILLDLMLGEESSLQHIEPILAQQPHAKLIVLTGYASIPTTVQALRKGAANYLAKPVGVHEVLAALEDDSVEVNAESRPLPLARVEWEHIQRVLAEHSGNVSAAARALGVHRRSLQRKLAKRPPR